MDQMKGFSPQMLNRDAFTIPKLAYESYFKIFGLISSGLDFGQRYGPVKQDKTSTNLKRFYCQFVCLLLWFFAIRSFVLMFIGDREIQLMMGDLTGFWNDYRMYYLMPTFYYSLQTAIIATIFLRNESELAWLVPFISVKQMQTNSIRTAKYDTNNHERRTQITIIMNNLIVLVATGMVAMLYLLTAYENMDDSTFKMFIPWIGIQAVWIFFMTGINMFTMTYFNLVCLILSNRFKQVCKDIEALAESDPGPLGSKNNALSTLYYEHNEICELVDESNSFWQSFIFFNYLCHIPCNCYALYNLFFAEFDDLLAIVTWTVFLHTILFLAFISLSAADVSAEAHSPYTALHTLSLLQLPIDLEVNMSTFLHRVRGPTIGFSCLDLFVITNASISNTIAAVASYFLIVADFSRSTAAANAAEKREEAAKAAMNLTSTTVAPPITQ
ncbi:gustatory receptor 64a [Dermatophagoides pteronyssinus]|uniref:Uncharacterized protein n=2 Tax=Dermatophagoides pteronyssinus TaxID=6956 RepID=A0ABQ8J3H1_DERPT|nr:uncharacterized protein LOC113789992 [Dermatophagoides pteronyssinus]KAH9417127.1 hypothetical protein DERP_013297 [Dermatophagoides pteronyssinus]